MPTVRKAVIPAAGLGTRFLPATKAIPKEMIPVVDRPTIQYVVEEAVGAGIDDVLVITGRSKRAIEDHFDRNPELEQELANRGKDAELAELRTIDGLASFHYVRQGEALGLGHAIGVAREHVGDEPFAVLLGDDFMDGSDVLRRMIDAHDRTGHSVVALTPVDREHISLYGSADAAPHDDERGIVRVGALVEKPAPEDAPSNLAVIGRYVFTPAIFDAIDRTPPGRGGEIQITDAIDLLAREQEVYGVTFEGGRFDTGNKLDYLKTTFELALRRDDVGPDLAAWIVDHLRDRGLLERTD